MEYNPIEHICEFIKDHLNVPYLYIRRVGDERLSVVLKPKDAEHVILLVYKTDNGDYVVQLDDDNATAILRKTRFNNFVPLDYNNPDKILQSITGSFSELVITLILTFLNKRFLEISLSQYIDSMIPNGYESSVKPAAMTYDISPTLKLRVTEVLECDNVLELQFNDNDGTVVIAKNENFTEIEIESVWKEVKGEALEFFNDFKQKLGIKESANMTVATSKSNQVTKVEVPTADNTKMPVRDLLKLRNYIVQAMQELPSYKNIVELYGPLNIRYRITLLHKDKTVSLDVGVEGDACILRSSEMYANYSFKYSRLGNILMQRNVHKRYPNENIGASLTTDTVNEVLCYLNDTFKKIPLFDYIRPALNKWDGKGNVVKGKCGSPNQSYLVIFGNYKSVTIKETQIPEELQFISMNCNGGEGIIRVAENGEDIEIVVDRTKIENQDLQSFIDHLVKELNAIVTNNSTDVLNVNEDDAAVIPEEEPVSYPVIIRKNSMVPTKDNLHHLVGEGVHLIEETYRLDNDSITVSDTMSILTSGTNVCIRERQLHNSRIYLVNSAKIPTGKFIVILPNTNLPQVRVKLVHRIGIDDIDVERTILEHDAVYSDLNN